jgi:hypothetical protein
VIDPEALRNEARQIAAERLLRSRGLLAAVAPEERLAIEQVAYSVALGVAEGLVEEAAENRLVEAALATS